MWSESRRYIAKAIESAKRRNGTLAPAAFDFLHNILLLKGNDGDATLYGYRRPLYFTLKFQQLMRPGDRADLTLRHDAARHKLHFAYRDGDKAYSSGRLAWSAET